MIVGGIIAFFVEVVEDSMYYRKKRKEMAQKKVKTQPQEESAISRFCPICGKELLKLDSKLCSHCGSRLEED